MLRWEVVAAHAFLIVEQSLLVTSIRLSTVVSVHGQLQSRVSKNAINDPFVEDTSLLRFEAVCALLRCNHSSRDGCLLALTADNKQQQQTPILVQDNPCSQFLCSHFSLLASAVIVNGG